MTERTYQSDTMANVLGDVKHDLGRDAVILRTRSYRKGGFMGLVGGKPMWEITACAADELSGDQEQGQYVAEALLGRIEKPLPQEPPKAKPHLAARPYAADALAQLASAAPSGVTDRPGLAGEVSELKQMVSTLRGIRKYSMVRARAKELGGIIHSSATTSKKLSSLKFFGSTVAECTLVKILNSLAQRTS